MIMTVVKTTRDILMSYNLPVTGAAAAGVWLSTRVGYILELGGCIVREMMKSKGAVSL